MTLAVRWLITSLMVVSGGMAGLFWLQSYQEHTLLDITASREPDIGLPVFAQFVVTQRLTLTEPHSLTRIGVPMYLPVNHQQITFDLRRYGKLIQRWRIQPEQRHEARVEVVQLPLAQPVLIDGDLEFQIAATAIDHDHQHEAPRVFIETADEAYPAGNYRIAGNEKRGDVSLLLYARMTRLEHKIQMFQANPALQLTLLARYALCAVLLLCLPTIIEGLFSSSVSRRVSQ